jgi:hypothetical protein
VIAKEIPNPRRVAPKIPASHSTSIDPTPALLLLLRIN